MKPTKAQSDSIRQRFKDELSDDTPVGHVKEVHDDGTVTLDLTDEAAAIMLVEMGGTVFSLPWLPNIYEETT